MCEILVGVDFYMRMAKNTKIVYTDDRHLKMYEAMSPDDFKEYFMTYFKYRMGDAVEEWDFTNPMTYVLFLSEKAGLDYNEAKWEKRAAANRENGQKGGRPRKSEHNEEEYKND